MKVETKKVQAKTGKVGRKTDRVGKKTDRVGKDRSRRVLACVFITKKLSKEERDLYVKYSWYHKVTFLWKGWF